MSEFNELPAINPKTGEPPKLFVCSRCGLLTATRSKHLEWHEALSKEIASNKVGKYDWP